MHTIFWRCLLFSSVLLTLYINYNYGASIKMTNAVCNSYNKSWVVITQCRLKALQRDKTILNVDMDFLHPVNDIDVRIQILRKANGYKPWLFDITFDACKYMRRPNNPAIKAIFGVFKEYTTINHTCPYYGHQGISKFYPKIDNFPIPFPTGDYLFIFSFDFIKQRTFDVNVYFSYVEDIL